MTTKPIRPHRMKRIVELSSTIQSMINSKRTLEHVHDEVHELVLLSSELAYSIQASRKRKAKRKKSVS